MFKSYEYLKYLGYNEKTKKYEHQYKIIDDDFEEVRVGVAVGVGVAVVVGVGVAVVETYRKRNLDVAVNLYLSFNFYREKYGYSWAQIISWQERHNPYWHEYKDKIDLYRNFE